jgi:hypothetical protein
MKYKIVPRFLISTGVATLFLLSHNSTAYASPVSLSVYPPVIEIETTSPTTLQTPIFIQNNTDNSVDLTIGVKPFKASDDFNGQVNYFPKNYVPEPDKNIFKHITLTYQDKSISSLILAPKDKKNLSLNVSLPSNETSADYYFSLVFLSKAGESEKNTGTVIKTGIATNVLLSIGKRTTPLAEVANFSSPYFVSHGPVSFTALIRNNNDQIAKAGGHILVTNMFGQTIGNIIIPEQFVLANSQRYLSNGYSSNNQPVSLWGESFLLGPYNAKLEIPLSDKGPMLEKTIYFFAFPVPLVGILLLGLVIVLLIFKRVKKKLHSINK